VIDAPSEGKAPSEAAPAEARAKDSAQDLDVVGGEVGEVEAAGPAPVAESLSAPAPAEPAKAAPRRTTPAPGAILRRPVSPGGVAQKRTNVGAPAPAAPAPAVNGKELEKVQSSVAELGKVMRGIESSMVRIAEAYQRVAKDGKRKDQAYDQLYEELRQYKDDWLLNAQKPLFRDVVLLYDSIARQLANFEQVEGAQLPREAVLGALKHLRDEVLEVLYRRDVERIEDTPPKLTIDFQKPVRRVDTDDPEQDRDVTQVLRDGFRLRGAVLRPQEVVVKRHVGSAGSGGTPSAAAEATPKERESP
jgi:molecular chaperone GrpE (heat shock protein)